MGSTARKKPYLLGSFDRITSGWIVDRPLDPPTSENVTKEVVETTLVPGLLGEAPKKTHQFDLVVGEIDGRRVDKAGAASRSVGGFGL